MDSYLTNIAVDEATGVIKATVNYEGMEAVPGKTFFPSSWTIEQLFHEMRVAMLNPIEILDRGGRRIEYTGLGTTGVKIKMIFEKTGKLVTAYPTLKKIKGIRQ